MALNLRRDASAAVWRLTAKLLVLMLAGRAGADTGPGPAAPSSPRARYVASQAGAWSTTGLFGGATDPVADP